MSINPSLRQQFWKTFLNLSQLIIMLLFITNQNIYYIFITNHPIYSPSISLCFFFISAKFLPLYSHSLFSFLSLLLFRFTRPRSCSSQLIFLSHTLDFLLRNLRLLFELSIPSRHISLCPSSDSACFPVTQITVSRATFRCAVSCATSTMQLQLYAIAARP